MTAGDLRHPSRQNTTIPPRAGHTSEPVPSACPPGTRKAAIHQAHPCRFPFGEPALPVPATQ